MRLSLNFDDVNVGDQFTVRDDAYAATWAHVVTEMRKRGKILVLMPDQPANGKRFEVRGRLRVAA